MVITVRNVAIVQKQIKSSARALRRQARPTSYSVSAAASHASWEEFSSVGLPLVVVLTYPWGLYSALIAVLSTRAVTVWSQTGWGLLYIPWYIRRVQTVVTVAIAVVPIPTSRQITETKYNNITVNNTLTCVLTHDNESNSLGRILIWSQCPSLIWQYIFFAIKLCTLTTFHPPQIVCRLKTTGLRIKKRPSSVNDLLKS